MTILTPAEKAMISRILRRERKRQKQFLHHWAEARSSRESKDAQVDAWIARHPEQFEVICTSKLKHAPSLLSPRGARDLAKKLARNHVYAEFIEPNAPSECSPQPRGLS